MGELNFQQHKLGQNAEQELPDFGTEPITLHSV